jgi:hypothetical protein
LSTFYQKFTIQLITEGSNSYFRLNVLGNEEISVEDVKDIADACNKAANSKVLPLLIVVDAFTLPSPQARKYIALPNSNPYAKAEAYVINDMAQKIVGNFFLKFDKPARPTKIFSKETDAVKWLEQFAD